MMYRGKTIIYKAITIIILFLTCLIWGGTFSRAQMMVSEIFMPILKIVFFLLMSSIILGFYIIIFRKIDSMKKRGVWMVTIATACFILAGYACMLMNFCPYTSSDALNIQDVAVYFAKTGKKVFSVSAPNAKYFGKFSNNYFLTILLAKTYKFLFAVGIKDVYFPIFVMAVIGMIIATVFLYLTGILMGGRRLGAKILLFCAGNPVYYILPMWLYTNVFSIPFTAGVVYFSMRIWKREKVYNAILSSVGLAFCLAVGYYIRPTVVISFIAFVLCYILHFFDKDTDKKKEMRKVAVSAATVCLVGGILIHLISTENQKVFADVSENNFPVTHWLMMASHGNGAHNIKDVLYTSSFATKEEKQKATTQKMLNNYKSYTPVTLLQFLENKLQTSWAYADGGDLMRKASQDTKYTGMYSWVFGSQNDLFRMYCYSFRFANLCCVLIAFANIWKNKKENLFVFFCAVSFLGGICFYSIWEVKPSYGMPFIMFLLLAGCHGVDIWNEKNKEKEKQRFTWKKAISIICVLGICLINANVMSNTKVVKEDSGIHYLNDPSVRKMGNDKANMQIRQEFYMHKPFNQIRFLVGGKHIMESNIKVTLCDENENLLYQKRIQEKIYRKKQQIKIKFPTVFPSGKTKFVLNIKNDRKNGEKVWLYKRNENYIKSYEGENYIDGRKENANLQMNVGNVSYTTWCTRKQAFLINTVLAMCAITEIMLYRKRLRFD